MTPEAIVTPGGVASGVENIVSALARLPVQLREAKLREARLKQEEDRWNASHGLDQRRLAMQEQSQRTGDERADAYLGIARGADQRSVESSRLENLRRELDLAQGGLVTRNGPATQPPPDMLNPSAAQTYASPASQQRIPRSFERMGPDDLGAAYSVPVPGQAPKAPVPVDPIERQLSEVKTRSAAEAAQKAKTKDEYLALGQDQLAASIANRAQQAADAAASRGDRMTAKAIDATLKEVTLIETLQQETSQDLTMAPEAKAKTLAEMSQRLAAKRQLLNDLVLRTSSGGDAPLPGPAGSATVADPRAGAMQRMTELFDTRYGPIR